MPYKDKDKARESSRNRQRIYRQRHLEECKERNRNNARRYRNEHLIEIREKQKKYYYENKDKNKEKDRQRFSKYREENKSVIAYSKIKCRYGLSKEEYNLLLENQDYKCKICGESQINLKRKLCIDHNHNTGEVRGLLCDNCNRLLGNAKDNVEILQNAINYLSS